MCRAATQEGDAAWSAHGGGGAPAAVPRVPEYSPGTGGGKAGNLKVVQSGAHWVVYGGAPLELEEAFRERIEGVVSTALFAGWATRLIKVAPPLCGEAD